MFADRFQCLGSDSSSKCGYLRNVLKGLFLHVALDISFILFCINKQTNSVVHVVFFNGVWLLHYFLIFQLCLKRHYGLDSFSLFLILRIGFCWYIPTNYFVMFHFYHCGKWHLKILIFINRCQLIVWWTNWVSQLSLPNIYSDNCSLRVQLFLPTRKFSFWKSLTSHRWQFKHLNVSLFM